MLDETYLKAAANTLNERIKLKLQITPEEIKALEERKLELEKEVNNLMDFIVVHGNHSQKIKDALEIKEREMAYVRQRVGYLKTVTMDKLFMTPFALKDRFERLTSQFEEDPQQANLVLRDLIPNGIKCTPTKGSAEEGKYVNQWNSGWNLVGELAIAPSLGAPVVLNSNLGLQNLEIGGEKWSILEMTAWRGRLKSQAVDSPQQDFGSRFCKCWFRDSAILVPIVVPNEMVVPWEPIKCRSRFWLPNMATYGSIDHAAS